MAWFSDGVIQILWNVVGGAVTAGLFEGYTRARRLLERRKYRAVFGTDLGGDDFHLVYGVLSLKPLEPVDPRPYRKAGLPDVEFSIQHPISSCELRAAILVKDELLHFVNVWIPA